MNKPAIILTSPEELRQARLNQPRVSSEEVAAQRKRHRLASEAFAEAAKSGTWKPGRVKLAAGSPTRSRV